jgi:TetR/AcrR family transcriptional regulator
LEWSAIEMVGSRDPEATRAAILDAAEEVFLAKGYGNAAMSQIARRAGITKSLIHHHFGSKEGLWREVKMRRFSQYLEQQAAMLEEAEPSAELLQRSMDAYFRFLQANPQIVRILAWVFLEQDDDFCLSGEKELTQAGIEKIVEGQRKGQLRDDLDPRCIIFTFLGLAQHWFQDRHHFINDFGYDGNIEDLDEHYLSDMAKIFFEGILPRR